MTPEKIRPGQPIDIYFFCLTSYGLNVFSATVTFSLEGTSYQGGNRTKTVIVSKKFDMDVTKPNVVSLDVPYNIDKSFAHNLDLKAEGLIKNPDFNYQTK